MKMSEKISVTCLALLACLSVMTVSAQSTTPQTTVTIAWTISPSTNIVSQTIGWGLNKGAYTQTVNVSPNANSFQITGLQPATTYHIAVLSTQALGTFGSNMVASPWSPECVHTTHPNELPKSPTNVKVVSTP